ncbi:MAG: hypothetical protein ACRDZU_02825 [Acidimicrobiales bacterium]
MSRHAPAALGTVIAGLLAVGIVAAVTKTVDDGPDHPDAWDPRVADLVTYLEGARGLDFDHPVYVDFLTPAEYTKEATTDEGGLGADDRAELDRYAGELRALGVATGNIDLFAIYNQVSDGGTLAFYDPAEQRVKVRGVTMTISLEVTLVHELTHALQDQHFDLGRLESGALEPGGAAAFRGLVEGDAVRIEDDYIRGVLTPEQQATYDEEYAAALEASEAATGEVPAFVSASVGAPYLLGQPLTVMLANRGGNDAVDRAFRSPPETEEHLFDPASFLADEGSQDVDLDLDEDDEPRVFDEGSFGSPSWYLMLAERIDPKLAFEAALGWDSDAYAAFERDDRTCIRVSFAGDTPNDEAEMGAALTQWVTAMPGGEASAVEIDGRPGLEACDPGPDVDMALTGRAERALFVPSLWGYLVADAATRLEADGARCYARGVLNGLTYDEITDLEGTAFQGEAFQRTMIRAFDACSQASSSSALQSRSGVT